MAKLNCLIRNTQLADDIKGVILDLVEERLNNNKSVKIQDIYRDIREGGVEIDAESVGALYNEVFALNNSKLLSDINEIEQYVGAEFKQTQREIANAIVKDDTDSEANNPKQIGKVSPEKSIVNSLAKLFQKQFYPTENQTTQSPLLQMQNLVKKALQSKIPKDKKENNPVSVNQMLKDFFGAEETQFERLDGGINNLETLHKEVKKQVDNYVESITHKDMTQAQKDILREQWDNYTQAFMDSMYDIMLSKGQQQKLLTEALSNIQIDGKDITDKNGNIKWSELSKDNNVDEVRDKIYDLFRNGFTDKAGNKVQFTSTQAHRISEYYANLYQQKINDVIQRDIANERAKNQSPKNLVSDFVKAQGFFQLVKDKSGQLTKMKSKWDDLLREIKTGDNQQGIIQQLQAKLGEFLTQTDSSGNKIFDITNEKINEAKQQLEREIKSKLLPSSATPNNIQKLSALSQVNNGIAFNNSTQQALTKVAGVSIENQQVLNKINQLSQLAQSLIDNPDTAFAQQAFAQIDRKIRELIFDVKLNSKTVIGLQGLEDTMSALKSTLLLNPANVSENILTNIASLGNEFLRIMLSSPSGTKRKLAKQALNAFRTSFASHVSGGSHENVVNDYDTIKELSSGERFRFTSSDLQKYKDQPLREFARTPLKALHTAMRVIMNSFDAATMETLVRIQTANSLNNALKEAYGKEKGNELFNKAMDITPQQLQKIDTQVNDLVTEMNKAGIYPTVMDKALMKSQMKTALYINNLEGNQTLSDTDKKRIRDNMQGIVRGVSESTRLIGGKKKVPFRAVDVASWIPSLLGGGILRTQGSLLESAEKSRQKGNFKSAQGKQIIATSLFKNGIGSFLGGRLNFLYLALTTSPLGFLSAYGAQRDLSKLKQDKGIQETDIRTASPDEYKKYTELSQQVKSILSRAIMGSILTTAYAVAAFNDDDEEEGWWDEGVNNLMKTQSGRNYLMKQMPLFLSSIVYISTNSPDAKVDTVKERILDLGSRLFVMNQNWEYAERAINKAKDGEQLGEALASFIGANYNANFSQDEQITKFIDVTKSMYSDEALQKVLDNEEISKAHYKQMEDWVEQYVGMGATEKLLRASGYKLTAEGLKETEDKVNRFADY